MGANVFLVACAAFGALSLWVLYFSGRNKADDPRFMCVYNCGFSTDEEQEIEAHYENEDCDKGRIHGDW